MFKQLLVYVVALPLLLAVCRGEKQSESEYLFKFLKAVDPQNNLRINFNGFSSFSNPCSRLNYLNGVTCNPDGTSITEIVLENLNLSGKIDADSLCKLKNLNSLNLARNLIRGSVPYSITYCRKLIDLNLSSNLLSGKVPCLTSLKYLKSLNISGNHFKVENQSRSRIVLLRNSIKVTASIHSISPISDPTTASDSRKKPLYGKWYFLSIPLVLAVGFIIFFMYSRSKRATKRANDRAILNALKASPDIKDVLEVIALPEEKQLELVFFVEDKDKFKLEDLLEATADLRSQSVCSTLYTVLLKSINVVYAVKRLKKLSVTFEEFSRIMKRVGNLKHPNILPLVGYNSGRDEKLLIYQYQNNGSLLNLLENHVIGKKEFPWKHRLSIACGIARGLDFIYQMSKGEETTIPHGNIKLSNILLDENWEPKISEHGISALLDPNKASVFNSTGYTAPEKSLSEQGDVFSFGVVLLELLTGKIVEKSGIDLPKWVRAMVREEWTGEVFDKEVTKNAKHCAFPLLNVSLKCVARNPEDRPSMAEVLEMLVEISNENDHHDPPTYEDCSISSMSSITSSQHDGCLLHTVIPETWDTPGSNHLNGYSKV